jgi:hypothetical protein
MGSKISGMEKKRAMVETKDVAMTSTDLLRYRVQSPTAQCTGSMRVRPAVRQAVASRLSRISPGGSYMQTSTSCYAIPACRVQYHTQSIPNQPKETCEYDKKGSCPGLGIFLHRSGIGIQGDGRNKGSSLRWDTERGGGKRELQFTPLLKIAAR